MQSSVPDALMETIEKSLDAWLGPRPDLPPALLEAMRYATLGAGKRLRPALAWHASVAAGGRGEDALAAGCAIELVHAFSLVHDDLPALDNDDLRRGRPTLHRYAGEAMAILAGDQLLIEAFARIAEEPGLSDTARATLLRELASASSRMVYGQVYDTLAGLPDALDARGRLVLVHRNKTGALIGAACRMGALSARPASAAHGDSVPALALGAITRYADAIGLMFQVVDDLIDATQTSEHAGKRTGKDAEQGKLTYPGVLGVEGTRAEVRRLHAESVDALAGLGSKADGLRTLANLMAERTR
jgi:geranylgeranyl pyrophosphate synthase